MDRRKAAPDDLRAAGERLARASAGPGSGERARAILAERARTLAAPPERAAREPVATVALDAGEERYAIPAEVVARVERAGPVARLPEAAPALLGLVSLAGRACALVDLPAMLGVAPPRTAPPRWVVALGSGRPSVALAGDEAALLDVDPGALRPPGPDRDGLRAGLTPDARLVLDGRALLLHAERWLRERGASPRSP